MGTCGIYEEQAFNTFTKWRRTHLTHVRDRKYRVEHLSLFPVLFPCQQRWHIIVQSHCKWYWKKTSLAQGTKKTRPERDEIAPVMAYLSGQLIWSCPRVHLHNKRWRLLVNVLVLEMNQRFPSKNLGIRLPWQRCSAKHSGLKQAEHFAGVTQRHIQSMPARVKWDELTPKKVLILTTPPSLRRH